MADSGRAAADRRARALGRVRHRCLAVDVPVEPGRHARPLPAAVGVAQRTGRQLRLAAADDAVGQELAVIGRHDEAIARLREAAPRFPRAYYHLGGELFNQGRIDDAVPALQNFVRLEPQLAEAVPARTMMGRAFMQQQRWLEAEEQLRLVLSMAPSRSPAHTTALGFLADTLFAEQKFAEARGAYVTYLGERP